ncbi:MAG: acylneuraminate cytidylyltransferase family protein, partial [Candidatus Margulisiibacteriota bacterium]
NRRRVTAIMDEKILITIAGRGGSQGVKDKNIKDLCGLPLIAHTILQAKKWGKAVRVVCTTDSEKIAAVAMEYGAEAPFMRPAELATSTIGKLPVLKHSLQSAEEYYNEKYDIVIDLDATSPIRKLSDIEGSLAVFLKHRPKSVFSVTPARKNPYFNMVETDASGYARLVKKLDSSIVRRQDAPKVFDMNASIYVYDRDYLLADQTVSAISDCSMVWVMDELSAFDIDTELDFQFVEFLVSRKLVSL